MSVIRDESLRDHARAVRDNYEAHAESIVEFSEGRATARELLRGDPWDQLPSAVADAKAEYEAAMNVKLRLLKFTRVRNGELEDAIDYGEPLPEDPVQLTRSVTVSSTEGAIVILEQWLAVAESPDES
jgi:hypothetical protein